jgi:HD-like signal output (HDOD) protein
MSNLEHTGIEYWTEKLCNTEMPVLSNVVSVLNKLTGDDTSEFKQLAEVILKDPHLTTQILKLANSVQYNPSGNSISTISRAIVILGFRKVRTMCISLMVVDSLLSKEPRERLLATMAKAFFAAVQAKEIYKQISLNAAEQEEVFIASLLLNLGEMVFWAYGGKSADALDISLMESMQNSSNYLIEKQLGTSFKSLSRELSKTWNLGELLQLTLSPKGISSPGRLGMQAQAVLYGDALSKLRDDQEERRKALVMRIAKFIKFKAIDAAHLINDASGLAEKTAIDFGAPEVSKLMPKGLIDESTNGLPSEDISTQDKLKEQMVAETIVTEPVVKEPIVKEVEKPVPVLTPDLSLQLKILRDLSNGRVNSMDMNTVFQTALEGMHIGIGLERMVLAFFNKDQVEAKYILGEGTENLRNKFSFNVGDNERNIFSENIKKAQPVWLKEAYIKSNKYLYTEDISAVIGVQEAFIGVLKLNNRNVVMFYADRSSTGEALTEEQFESFGHFLTQAELGVQSIASRRQA